MQGMASAKDKKINCVFIQAVFAKRRTLLNFEITSDSSCSRSPPVADFSLATICQFRQPTFRSGQGLAVATLLPISYKSVQPVPARVEEPVSHRKAIF